MEKERHEPQTLAESHQELREGAPKGVGTEAKTHSQQDEWVDLYRQSLQDIEEGEVVRGTIVAIRDNEVLVDVGYKSEGTIPLEEFHRAHLEPKVGEEIDVFLEMKEDAEGLIVLSKEKADKIRVWDVVGRAFEKGSLIEGKVVEVVKGGLSVDVGVRAFLPGSQVDVRPVKNLTQFLGQTIQAKVIKLNRRRGNVVLSRRMLLEEERDEKRKHTFSVLQEGMILSGVVKNITEYGVFVDLGGIDGLLHITDMCWGRINHPSELFQVGDRAEVMVLHFDRDAGRVSLGYKQKEPDPWENVETKYPISARVRGKVVSLTNYGAFVELEKGVEGLVHVSEMSWTRRVRHPSKIVNEGDEVEVQVLEVNRAQRRISLGMKQVEADPWTTIDQRLKVGMRIEGKVRNLTDFGAFVELEPGIDGLLHISDMSWTRNIGHPSEILKKSQSVETIVLNVDKIARRISLGLKQIQPDPWENIAERYPLGSRVTGKVVRITEFGAFVELEKGVDGLLHVSQMARHSVSRPEDVVATGDELVLKIIKLDPAERRIGLSLRDLHEDVVVVDDYRELPAPDRGGRRRDRGRDRGRGDEEEE